MFARYAVVALIASFAVAAVISPGCDPCASCNTKKASPTATATGTQTPTPTATATVIPPTNVGSGAVENGNTGNTFINCTAGSGLVENNVVVLVINALGAEITITPPAEGPGMPPWNLIDSQTVNGDYQ